MFIDARTLPANEIIDTQICIVGAGAAGITLAREFSGAPFDVCLLESGGFDIDGDTQDLYAGDSVGHDFFPLEAARLRFFGGTTNHWAGYSRPLDPIDFERRDYIANSGWPFGRDALDPYYRRAATICELGEFQFESIAGFKPYPLDPQRVVSEVLRISPPTRFGERYRDDVAKATNVRTFLHANVVDIGLDGERATELTVATLDGKRFVVRAKLFVLASGGIENARLLLSANGARPAGIGNAHDSVGRYFMDHPVDWTSGRVVTNARLQESMFYSEQTVGGGRAIGYFALPPETLHAERLYHCAIQFDWVNFAAESGGLRSGKHLFNSLRNRQFPDNLGYHLGRILGDFDDVVDAAYRAAAKPTPRHFVTRFWCECPPDRDSRVTLGDERDDLGLRRVKLDWRLPADIKRTYMRMHEALGEELGRQGIGRLQIGNDGPPNDPRDRLVSSYHHMGTTRMHESPRQGVVDAECRVHDVANLYVAGSSVFPTYGHANPTFTIVALATRLADRLKRRMTEEHASLGGTAQP